MSNKNELPTSWELSGRSIWGVSPFNARVRLAVLDGIAGLNAANANGLMIDEVGISETKDETITRVKWYTGLALFSEKGLAALSGVTN